MQVGKLLHTLELRGVACVVLMRMGKRLMAVSSFGKRDLPFRYC